ncbi:MAG: T9SS type A sorting domain-containing protein [Salibacteraceae bacterium]
MKLPRTLILLLISLFFSSVSVAQDFTGVPYGPGTFQFMDIYLAPNTGNCPNPVYFDAHGNNATTAMPSSIIDSLKALGVSVVAWESLPAVNTPMQVETGWDDAELMIQWVHDHADSFNFDTTRLIIGGSSRGSILSWKYSHRPHSDIKGLYMYNALPDGVWMDTTWWYPPNEVTTASPEVFFVYRFEPGIATDIHDPLNGMAIMDRYTQLGIGDRDTLIHSIEYSGNTNKYQFLPNFIRSVLPPCIPVNVPSTQTPTSDFQVFPNPFRDEVTIRGLQGNKQFALRTLSGTLVAMTSDFDAIPFKELSSGVYLLSIQSGENNRVLKLLKQ